MQDDETTNDDMMPSEPKELDEKFAETKLGAYDIGTIDLDMGNIDHDEYKEMDSVEEEELGGSSKSGPKLKVASEEESTGENAFAGDYFLDNASRDSSEDWPLE